MKSKIAFGLLKPDCILRNLEDQIFEEIIEHGFEIIVKKKDKIKKGGCVFSLWS